ncbi:PREDICTED: dentin sialophosphoprotein-like [Lipotes vexillifer]|uniref:Dentin sialophosphoprotein-like n=1 Tax=Lipotes vexillifer TaxID=118797 RepID=A0A340WXD4_LIPVE|nr:PREDICTED: dentin sialophosphoprotein-like [Lipotes vexillifer]
MEMEREQCVIQSENERLQMDEDRGKYLIKSDREKEHKILSDKERHHLDSENEAQWLGARRKDNRPQGFWRPIFLSPPHGQEKETEEQHSVQQIDNRVSRIQLVRYLSDDKIVRFKEVSPTLSDKQDSQQKLKEKHSPNLFPDTNTFMDNKHNRNASHNIYVCKSHYTDYRYQQRFQSSGSQMNPIHLLSAEDYTSQVLAPICHSTSMSPFCVVRPKTQINNTHTLDTGAQVCSKCFVEINNSSFHKCLVNSDDDSEPYCPLHLQIPLDSKYSLSPKSIRHHKTSRNSPLARSLDPKHSLGVHCPLHWEDSKYSLGSTFYLHCESYSALQILIGSTVTHTFPMNPQNNIGHHNTPGPDNVIKASSIACLESKSKFKHTAKFENEVNPDNETKLVSTGNLKDKANAKGKPLLKDETDSEDEKDPEDETDPEDENNTKDKKDPKDKPDPDDTDPKDSNAENDADTRNGSDPSGDSDPTSGADANSDGNSNNGTDSSSEPDSNIDNATNNDANSKYNTDSEEEKHTNNSGSFSGLDIDDQVCTADSNIGTNPNYTSSLQDGSGLDYTSGSSNGADLSTGSSSNIGLNNGPGPNINGPDLQNNGPGPQYIRPGPLSPGPSNNGSSPDITGPGPNNSPVPNNNNPGPNNNNPDLEKDPDSNYNSRLSNATSHNSAFSPNKDADSIYETKPISSAGHNYAVILNCNSNLECVPGFIHAVGSNFVVNPSYIARNIYAASPSSTASTVNVTGTSNTSCTAASSPTYTPGTSCASDNKHDPRFIHVIGSSFVINTNYDAINTHNVHNLTSTSNANNLSETELEINFSSSIPNSVYSNSPIFVADTNYISTPENLTTSKFSDPSKLDRNYTVFADHKFGAYFKDYTGSMDSASFKHVTESKDALDARESGFLKDFSEVQNPIGIKNPGRLNFCSNSNISLPSFDIIVEAEPLDVVKFAIPSGAVNPFFKSLDKDSGALRAEEVNLRGAMQGTTKRSSDGPA